MTMTVILNCCIYRELENELNELNDRKKENLLVKEISKLDYSKSIFDDLSTLKTEIDAMSKNIGSVLNQSRSQSKLVKELITKRNETRTLVKTLESTKKQELNAIKKLEESHQKLRQDIANHFTSIRKLEKLLMGGSSKFVKLELKLKQLERRLEQQREYEQRQAQREAQKKKWEELKALRKQQMEERKKKQEEYERQWLEYEAERKKNPYEKEIHLCGFLITYLNQLAKTTKAAQLKQQSASLLTGRSNKNTSGSGKNNKSVITHPIDKFNAFQQLSIKPPLTYQQVAEALKVVTEKKAYYKTFKVDEILSLDDDISQFAPITTVESDVTALINDAEEEEENENEEEDEDNTLPESSADMTVSVE